MAVSNITRNLRDGELIIRDGTAGIKIQTKVRIPGQKTQKIGGYWTADGKLVTFWD